MAEHKKPSTEFFGEHPRIEVVKPGTDAFAALKAEMYISDRYEDTLRRLESAGSATILALRADDGRYAGRVTLRQDWTDAGGPSGASVDIAQHFPGLPQVNALEVHENYRRRGFARRLMAALEDIARRQGFSRLGLGVEVSNTPAIKLYEQLGYSLQKVDGKDAYQIWFGDPDPKIYELYLMIKDIGEQAKEATP